MRRIEGDAWHDRTVAMTDPIYSVWRVMADNQGYLWIGMEKGVVCYKPSTNLQPPSVEIRRIDSEEIPEGKVYLTGRSYVT